LQPGPDLSRVSFGQQPLGRVAEVNIGTVQPLDELVRAFTGKVELPGRGCVLVTDAVEPAALAVDAGGIAIGVLVAVIAVVPVEDIKATVGPRLLRDGHE